MGEEKKKAKKKECIWKNVTKIIVATISAIALIVVALIQLKGKLVKDADEEKNKNIQNDSSIFINGENKGNITFTNNEGQKEEEKSVKKEEHVTIAGKMNRYVTWGEVDGEEINMYPDKERGFPICDFDITNENDIVITIKDVFVEVTDYKSFDEFIVKYPVGGASMVKMIFWSCDISPEKDRYRAILLGDDENNEEDLSGIECAKIEDFDSGQFKIKIFPDTPGLYVTNIIVQYTSYDGEIKEIMLPNMKFIYDPNLEANIDGSYDGRYGTN